MDFKSAMRAEMEARLQKLANATTSEPVKSGSPGSRANVITVKHADLERVQLDELASRQRAIDDQRAAKKRGVTASLPAAPAAASQKEEDARESVLVDECINRDVERKLKNRNEPIRLFGESDRQRLSRLKTLELKEEERNSGQAQVNEFNQILQRAAAEAEARPLDLAHPPASHPEPPSLSAMQIEPVSRMLLLKERERAVSVLIHFFKALVKEWRLDLQKQAETEQGSAAFRMSTAIHQQACEHLKPLIKALRRDTLPEDVLAHLVEIVSNMQQREYVRANDCYLRLSIGNAPWPIGVTMVGIHERSAHEKITSSSVAHVLNDEISRKWIQAVKRLMTFCQRLHPPADLSKAMG